MAELKSIQSQLVTLPSAKLICTKNGKYFKYYQSDGHTFTYIPKKNRKLAEKLAIKGYLSELEKSYLKEISIINSYLKYHQSFEALENRFLSSSSGYAPLLATHFKHSTQELEEWQNAPFEQNPKFPEQLIHKTINGIYVRSKSEYMIATQLILKKIPFRYECQLLLNNIPFYPDFTIRHPKTGEVIYWEHFGMMDDPTYCKNSFSKLQFFISNEIIPSLNLITTYETLNHPLTSDIVEQQIQLHLS